MPYLRRGDTPPAKGRGSKLTPLMKRFLEELQVDLNPTEAVIRAGYKVTSKQAAVIIATELQNHPIVSVQINEIMNERKEKYALSADYVINKLIDIVENTERGNPTAALRGLELLGKTISLFKDRQEISGPDGEAIKMEQKVTENVQDFTSKLSRLAASGGTGTVVKFPVQRGDGEA